MANFGHFLEKGVKIPGLGDPRAGVLHQPLAPGPRGSPGGVSGPPARRGGFPGFPGGPGRPPPGPGPRDRPGIPRGPGARGWCKTPLAGAPGPGSGTSGPRDPGVPPPLGAWEAPDRGSGTPDPGPRDPWSPGPPPDRSGRALPGLPGPPAPPARGVLHQPLAAGPRGSPGTGVRRHDASRLSRPPRALRVR